MSEGRVRPQTFSVTYVDRKTGVETVSRNFISEGEPQAKQWARWLRDRGFQQVRVMKGGPGGIEVES